MDYSTIDIEKLKSLPVYKMPDSCRLQRDSGMGCAGDPPGFPSYFLKSVYTKHGNSPSKGAQTVIQYEGIAYVLQHSEDYKDKNSYEKFHKRLRRLWKPLPLDHERTKLWIQDTYRHHHSGYRLAEVLEYGHAATVFWPVENTYQVTKFLEHDFFKNMRDDSKSKERANVLEYLRKQVYPENHSAVHIIREFYPEHQPNLELIENPPKVVTPQWWETDAAAPKPGECRPRSMGPHKDDFFCQWCGSNR